MFCFVSVSSFFLLFSFFGSVLRAFRVVSFTVFRFPSLFPNNCFFSDSLSPGIVLCFHIHEGMYEANITSAPDVKSATSSLLILYSGVDSCTISKNKQTKNYSYAGATEGPALVLYHHSWRECKDRWGINLKSKRSLHYRPAGTVHRYIQQYSTPSVV